MEAAHLQGKVIDRGTASDQGTASSLGMAFDPGLMRLVSLGKAFGQDMVTDFDLVDLGKAFGQGKAFSLRQDQPFNQDMEFGHMAVCLAHSARFCYHPPSSTENESLINR